MQSDRIQVTARMNSTYQLLWPQGTTHLRVGDVSIDLMFRCIVRPDETVELTRRMFDLLMVFLSEPNILHSRTELFDRVWPGLVVEDANLSQSIWMLRKALGAERKHWIRTRSKNGYVFEPPIPVEAVCDASLAPEVPALTPIYPPQSNSVELSHGAMHHATCDEAASWIPPSIQIDVPQAQAGIRRRRFGALLVISLIVAGSGSVEHRAPEPADAANVSPTRTSITVAVVQAADVPGAVTPHWPVDLLDEWISWKLDMLPETVRVDQNHLTAARIGTATRVVLLRAESVPGSPDRIVLRAHINPPGTDPRTLTRAGGNADMIELQGTLNEVPLMVDRLSQQVLAKLLPDRSDAVWPSLTLDAPTAQRYVEAARALRQRSWVQSATASDAVIRQAPEFAPAYLKLAEIRFRQGRNDEALKNMALGQRNLTGLVPDAIRILNALDARIDPRRQPQALEAYCSLSHDFRARTDFALTCASLRTRAGRHREALAILTAPDRRWEHESVGTRIRRHIILSETELALGYPVRTRINAQRVLTLIAEAGDGWDMERGKARMMLARAHHSESGRPPSPALYEQAAQAFETAGNDLDALYARALAENERPWSGKILSKHMSILVAEAHKQGFADLEIEILRMVGDSHYHAGRLAEYRELLLQAQKAANASGDVTVQRKVDYDLLHEDLFLANIASAEARIKRLKNDPLEGDIAYSVLYNDGMIQRLKGHFDESLERLRQGELANNGNGKLPTPARRAAELACLRMDILLAKGNLDAARALLDHCRAQEVPTLRLHARLLEATTDMYAGDPERAFIGAGEAERDIAEMTDGMERWVRTIEAGDLLIRLGEYDRAERMFTDVRQRSGHTGYGLLLADIEVGLAEIAAARGQWARSRQLSQQARRRVPKDLWVLVSRLDTLDIADAIVSRDLSTATTRATTLRKEAERLGDRVVQSELDSIMHTLRVGPQERQPPQINRKHLRGAALDWLLRASGQIDRVGLVDVRRPRHP